MVNQSAEREWLNGAQRARLQQLVDFVGQGVTFAAGRRQQAQDMDRKVGEALAEIRDSRLYLEHGTFEEFVRQHFAFSRSRAYQLIDLARVAEAVHIVDMPAPPSEAVARELAPLRDDPPAMAAALATAVEEHGPQPTAEQVREAVRGKDDRYTAVEDANAQLRRLPAAEKIAWPVEPGELDAIDAEVKALSASAKAIAASWSRHKRELRGLRSVPSAG